MKTYRRLEYGQHGKPSEVLQLIATIFAFFLIGSALAQSEAEIDALTAMINSWQNLPESWNINNVGSACSSFQGLICANNQITLLSLQVGLTGTIPAAIGNLTSLVLLDLSNNDLSGTLPAELGLLTELQAFNLEGNAFTGTIPASLYDLNKLKIFNVRDNQLGNGAPLPAEFSKLTNLQYLVLGKNNWSGPIPSNWTVLTNLIQLQLHYNPLKTNLPDWLFTALTKLEDFDALSCEIVGSIPATIGSAKKLKRFIMNNNNMTGSIPDAIGDAKNLVTILVFYNQLSGCLTARLGELPRLQELHLHYNQFSGGIPSSFGNLKNLKSLLMQGNRFSGEIPDSFGNLKNITTLSFAFNNLGGCIPQSFANLYLNYCDLQHNSDLRCCNSIFIPGACKATFDHSCSFAAWAEYNNTQTINLDSTPQAEAETSSASLAGVSILLGAVASLASLVF